MRNIHEMFSQWRKFLSNDKLLVEIDEKTILQDYQGAKEFIEKMVKNDRTAFYCLNLLIENINDYTRYLEIPSTPDKDFLGFRLKNSFLNKREDELTDDNVRSFIIFTYQCIEVLLSSRPKLKSKKAFLDLQKKIEKEKEIEKESLQDGTI